MEIIKLFLDFEENVVILQKIIKPYTDEYYIFNWQRF